MNIASLYTFFNILLTYVHPEILCNICPFKNVLFLSSNANTFFTSGFKMFSFLFGVNAGRSMFNTVGNLSPKQNTIHNVLILKYTTSLYAVDSSGQQRPLTWSVWKSVDER